MGSASEKFIFGSSVPSNLVRLFEIEKKSELESYSKTLEINDRDFVELVMNCHQLGYKHFRKHKEFVPDHLNLSDDLKSIKTNPKKVMRTISAIFDARKYISAHLFIDQTSQSRWHLFYFDFNDLRHDEESHWIGGSHAHFVNYLWPQHSPKDLFDNFENRKTNISGKLHIRFKQDCFD